MRRIHHAILKEICSNTTPKKILDVGCGNGAFTQVLAATFPSATVIALDTSVPQSLTSDTISFIKGSAESMPFVSEKFDLIISALSLHHWKEKSKGISEIYRVLKKEGRLIIGDPLLEDWMSNRFLGWLMQTVDGGSFTDVKGISGYLNAAGFKSLNIRLIPNTMKSLYLITAKK